MTDLGLDTLTDDQLVELARAIAMQIAKRNPAVADAAQNAIRDEIARAAKSQDNLWAKKKWLAQMAVDVCGADELTVWRAADRDVTRVYIDINGSDRRGRENVKWCYHVTGDSKNPPGSLTVDVGSRVTADADTEAVKIICRHAISAFSQVRIDCAKAAATDYAVPPMPADLAARLAEVKVEAERKAARAAYMAARRAELFGAIEADEKTAMTAHDVQFASLLPADVRVSIEVRRMEAKRMIDEAMAQYDAEHGSK